MVIIEALTVQSRPWARLWTPYLGSLHADGPYFKLQPNEEEGKDPNGGPILQTVVSSWFRVGGLRAVRVWGWKTKC